MVSALVPVRNDWLFAGEDSGGVADLETADKVPDANPQRLRDFQEIVHRRGFDPSLDPANEHRGKVGFLGQLLLTEPGFFPVGPDGLAEQATVFRDGRHNRPKKQDSLRTHHVVND